MEYLFADRTLGSGLLSFLALYRDLRASTVCVYLWFGFWTLNLALFHAAKYHDAWLRFKDAWCLAMLMEACG